MHGFLCHLNSTLIIGTGMWQPNIPNIPGLEYTEGYESVPTEAEHFEGQSVLIFGIKDFLFYFRWVYSRIVLGNIRYCNVNLLSYFAIKIVGPLE